MEESAAVDRLKAQLAEQERELARLHAELTTRDAAERLHIAEQLRQAEEKTRDLIRYAPTGIYEIDFHTGRFRTVNDAMCEILGYTRPELLLMTGFDLLDDAGRALFADRIRRTLAGMTIDPDVEYRVKRKDGSVIYGVLSTTITYKDGQPDGAFVIAHDVSERRRAAQELAAQREQFSHLAAEQDAILSAIADGLIVVDAGGRIVRLNARAEQTLGFSTEHRGLTIRERLAARVRPAKPDGSPFEDDEFPVERALKGEVVIGQEAILHLPGQSKPLWVAISSAPIVDGEGRITGAVSTFTDVDALHTVAEELRRTHEELEQRVQERTQELAASKEELRAYTRRLVDAIENERRSLARELHDQAGQSLSALMLGLDRLRRQVGEQGPSAEWFGEMGALVDGVLDDLHRLAMNLRPVSLDRYGLLVALQQYAEAFRHQSGIDLKLVHFGIEAQRLPAELETALYRVVQEALTNVLRHAKARHAGVMLERRHGQVVAIVEDDGQGFDLADSLRSNRLGLVGMRERAEMLGGTLTIETAPGQGTTVFLALPCRPAETH